MKKKCIVGRRQLACRRELAEGKYSCRARCESNICGRFALLFRIALSVERPFTVCIILNMVLQGTSFFFLFDRCQHLGTILPPGRSTRYWRWRGLFACHVIISVLLILNIVVIANTGISSHLKLTQCRYFMI